MTSIGPESKLVKKFRNHLHDMYGNGYFHNVHMTGMGVQGKPDIEVILSEVPYRPTWHIEVKKANSLKQALSKLRPSQKGHLRSYRKAKCPCVVLLWDTGCAQLDPEGTEKIVDVTSWNPYLDVDEAEPFSGFDELIKNTIIERSGDGGVYV